MNCIAYPGTKWFIGRNELKRIMTSTYMTFIKVCNLHKFPRESWSLNSQYNYIQFWNGSRIDLIDVAYKPSDPLYERFGSTEYTGGWLEEAGEIKEKAFDVLKSRIGRQLNHEFSLFPKILITCNPKKNWIYLDFYKRFKEGTLSQDSCFIQALYNDNPYTVEIAKITLNKIKDPVMRARLKDGLWEYDDDDSTIMNYEAILDIFTNPPALNPEDELYLSVDVARFGRDKATIFLWQGLYIRKIWYYDKSSMQFLEDKIRNRCNQWHIPLSRVIIDQDGVGGGLVDNLPGVCAFVNGASPVEAFDDDKKYRLQQTPRYSYKNLRSQCYFKLGDLVNAGKIGCYPEVDPEVRNWLIEELEAIRRKNVTDNEMKLQIINKDAIKDVIGRSCDFSDNAMMRCFFNLGEPTEEECDVGVVW